MEKYPKIQGLFKRNEKTHKFIEGEYSVPIFKYLKDINWIWTEKIDGMNIRVIWYPDEYAPDVCRYSFEVKDGLIEVRGRTNKAELKNDLIEKIKEYFLRDDLLPLLGDVPLTFYGEGYGAGIQKAGGNYCSHKDFILFDIYRDFWWDRGYMEEMGLSLDINVVPVVGIGTLEEGVEFIKKGFESTFSNSEEGNETFEAEGIVLKPIHELNYFRGRVITKIKGVDF